MSKKRVMVLGSTGSIGRSTLDVIRSRPEIFETVALSCRSSLDQLLEQIHEFRPRAVAISGHLDGRRPPESVGGVPLKVYQGEDGVLQMIEEVQADVVVNGLAGSSGLLPSLRTLESGRSLALSNKETYIMAGSMLMDLARRRGIRILPVDSELSALFNLLESVDQRSVDELILTASGGAFRDLPYEELHRVRLADALRHPNWAMGPKITVDSATMANKGLEVIGAHYLFDFPMERIRAVIHPQCYIHAMVRTRDGSLYAQISSPDMRVPIQNALSYPRLLANDIGPLDLAGREMTFRPIDSRKYRLFYLAYEVCRQGGAYPIAFNAANEVAVDCFLEEKISFMDIPAAVEQTLQQDWRRPAASLEDTLELDRRARSAAEGVLKEITNRIRTG
jgi:1-deoxy-D-xylulose-5-phosphate reductoisomerase